MPNAVFGWFAANYLEIIGAVLGIIYIFFSIRQNILTWPTGLASSVLYIFIFFQAKLYADMGLQFYYVFISIYGWWLWLKGNNPTKSTLKVGRLTPPMRGVIITASVILFVLIYLVLRSTDSPVPILDSFTTALSITATYLLARKILEHWTIWIIVNLVSAGLYIYKGLWPTTILFFVYTVMAITGLRAWTKDWKKQALPAANYA